jgi:ribosomal protein S18 acetylase RimI-like enzyme
MALGKGTAVSKSLAPKRCQAWPARATVQYVGGVRSRSFERRWARRGFVVRDARDGDLSSVAALLRDVFVNEGWLGDGRAGPTVDGVRLQASTGILLIAEDIRSVGLLGSVALVTVRSPFAELANALRAEISALAVSVAARKRGVGQALVQECMRRSAAMGLEETALSTQAEMAAAMSLYERIGFRRRRDLDFRVENQIRCAYVAPLYELGMIQR